MDGLGRGLASVSVCCLAGGIAVISKDPGAGIIALIGLYLIWRKA